MKKYLIIPFFFICAFTASYAGCGACEEHDHEHIEEKAECAEESEAACAKEKYSSEAESCFADELEPETESCCPE